MRGRRVVGGALRGCRIVGAAMHYSKVAQSSSAEIHVTQVKYVRKIKGAPAGKVEIRGEKSIHIRRDEKRIARLLATVES